MHLTICWVGGVNCKRCSGQDSPSYREFLLSFQFDNYMFKENRLDHHKHESVYNTWICCKNLSSWKKKISEKKKNPRKNWTQGICRNLLKFPWNFPGVMQFSEFPWVRRNPVKWSCIKSMIHHLLRLIVCSNSTKI